MIGAGQDDPLWPVLQACARRFERRSRDYEVQSHAPRVTSVQLQADLIASLPRGRLRGLCVQVIDPSASQAALDSLRNDGMVVVTLLKRLDTPGHFLHSGVDEHELGAALADALAALVESPGTVGTLEAKAQHDLRRRAQGFHARIGRYPRLTLLRELDCSQDPSVSAKMMQRTMERFAGLDGWAIMDNWPLRQGLGTHRLLPDSCRLVAPGPLANVAELIRTGQVDAVVLADYDDMVNKALQACAVTLDGELPLFREYNSTLLTVTADTLPEFQQRWKQWTQISEPAEQK
ncbi:MAG: substrate-binding domain-containing protein [Phycisphaerae bacterium]